MQDGSAPTEIHLLPKPVGGKFFTVDGRGPYEATMSAEELIAASFARSDKIEIDVNHSTYLAAPRGEPAPALGWIVAMQARADGIWGVVEWTSAGADLVTGKAYRAISPVFTLDRPGGTVVTGISNASLVNRPNIRGLTALHQQETDMTFMQKLAAKLGLGADASEEAILAAIGGKADDTAMQSALTEIGVALGVQGGDTAAILNAAKAAKSAAPAEITALQSEITTLAGQVKTLKDGKALEAATGFVDAGIKAGRAGLKPSRDRFIAMHMADPAGVEAIINNMVILSQSGTTVLPPAAKDGEVSLNAEQLAVAKMLGISPKDFAADVAAEQQETN